VPGRAAKAVAWSEIEPLVLDVVESLHIRTINGTAGDILDYETHRETGFNVIAVGGDKLARGLTLEGLSVSYFLRASRIYDTLMQMGRWFGFRPGYLDLCRLYTTSELNEWFFHITQASEELRREFDRMITVNGTPKDYGLKVRSHASMLVTSRVKMRNATEVTIDFAGAIQETVVFGRSASDIKTNHDATETLVTAMGKPTETSPTRARSDGAHSWKGTKVWTHVPAKSVVSFLRDYRTHETSYAVNARLLAEFVERQADHGELTDWTVALFSGERGLVEVAGHEISAVKRSENERFISKDEQRKQGRYLIRRLLAPRDEAIDFDAGAYDEALAKTVEAWHRDPGRSRRKTPPDSPSGPAIRQVRGRHPQHGLLLLYPLDPAVAEISSPLPVMGFGVSFPASKGAKPVKYMVGNVYYEQEFGEDA
jgi:hypothetical protein